MATNNKLSPETNHAMQEMSLAVSIFIKRAASKYKISIVSLQKDFITVLRNCSLDAEKAAKAKVKQVIAKATTKVVSKSKKK